MMKIERRIKILIVLSVLFLMLSATLWIVKIYFLEIDILTMQPAADMKRADLLYDRTRLNPKAVIVLAPGLNDNGYRFILDPVWRNFAKANNLGLVVISFANSNINENTQKGYYYVNKGSGKLLIDGIKKIYGQDLPVLMYGFSGGAHFVSRFAEWRPDRVLAWGAYSAAWWDDPGQSNLNPPGVVACGELDERFMASFEYFQRGRVIGKPWLWVGIKNLDHEMSPQLEEFMRDYFKVILAGADGIWMNFNDGDSLESHQEQQDKNMVWIPDRSLMDKWNKLKDNN